MKYIYKNSMKYVNKDKDETQTNWYVTKLGDQLDEGGKSKQCDLKIYLHTYIRKYNHSPVKLDEISNHLLEFKVQHYYIQFFALCLWNKNFHMYREN